MEPVRLVPVDAGNFRVCVKLTLEGEQANYVAPNVYSIAQARVEPWWEPYAIYAGDEMVGFAMFGREEPSGQYWVMRLMIAQAHQRRGYGRRAMHRIIELLEAREGCEEIWISFVPDNVEARNLYESLGFLVTDVPDPDGEIVLRRTRRPKADDAEGRWGDVGGTICGIPG
jgi:diamine N-acetyltransferase